MRLPAEKKYLIIGAPHTSNWDFPLAILALSAMGLPFSWVGKHTLFHFPFGYVFRALGGIPVDRHIRQSFIAKMIELFSSSKELVMAIAPEGTRAKTSQKVVVLYRRKKGTGGKMASRGQLQLSKARAWSGNSLFSGIHRIRTVETCNTGSTC